MLSGNRADGKCVDSREEDEKLNTGQEENPQPGLFDAGPAGVPAQDAPAPEPLARRTLPSRPLWICAEIKLA